jgi:hypothetical protein
VNRCLIGILEIRKRASASAALLPLTVCFLTTLMCVPLAAWGADGQSPFSFREANPTSLELTDHGKPVFIYNFGGILAPNFPEAMRRASYIHPVYAPDGTLLTDDFNPDHPHHRGISWMWPDVTVEGKMKGTWGVSEDSFKQRFVRWTRRDTKPDSAILGVENGWFDGERKLVKENVEIVVSAIKANRRILDFTLRFEATDRPVTIVGTSEGNKGFGGFCFRYAPRDGGAAETVILTDQGVSEKDGILSRHPWAEINGVFQGHPAGARIEDDPANPGYPNNGWLMRHKFGFLNPSYPGLKPLKLEPGKPLVLKYRVILFSGITTTK